MGTGILLITMEICTFHTDKSGNFNSLRDFNLIPMILLPWYWFKKRVSAKKCCGY